MRLLGLMCSSSSSSTWETSYREGYPGGSADQVLRNPPAPSQLRDELEQKYFDSNDSDGGRGTSCGIASVAAQQNGPSATRSFDKASVAPGGQVVVTIQVANYGGNRACDGDAARRVRLRIQHPRLGGSECERPGGQVHAARGCLRRLHGHRLQHGGVPLLFGYAQGLRHERSHRRRRYEGHGGGTECHSVLQLDIGGPRWKGSGHHSGRQLRWHRACDGDAARRVRLRIQHPRLGGSECERPGGQVHAARGCLRRLHGHRLQDGGVPLFLGYAQGLRHERSHGRRRYQDHGS